MTTYSTSIDRDANRQVLSSPLPFLAKKTMTFAGGTLNDPGDFNGTGNPATLFTVTGDVLVQLVSICKVSLIGAATLGLGVSDQPQGLGANLADTSTFLIKMYLGGGSVNYVGTYDNTSIESFVLGGSQDIIQTIGTADITAGQIVYYCFWRPISVDGDVSAA